MAKVPLEEVKKLLKEIRSYRGIDEEAVDYLLNNIEKYKDLLVDIDETEKRFIEYDRRDASARMEDWRVEKSAGFLVRDIAMKVPDEKFALKLFNVANRLDEFADGDLEDIERLKLRADTIEQFGLKAHEGLKSKEARWHLLQKSMIEESLLKYSLFVIVPFVAYVLLSRIK
jgi:hypothetical protein